MMRQLFNVVHQAVQLPLSVHFGFSAQCKSVQPFVAPQVSEHRLHGGEAPRDHVTAHVGVDLGLHLFDVNILNPLALEEGHLARFGFVAPCGPPLHPYVEMHSHRRACVDTISG